MNGIVVRARRQWCLLLVGAGAAAAVVAAPAGAAGQQCATSGKTVAANSLARVYSTTTPGGPEVFGCLYGRTSIKLASGSSPQLPRFIVAMSGPYVAVATNLSEVDVGQATLRVFDLRTGKAILRPRAASGSSSPRFGIQITAVVLSEKTVGWIASIQNFKKPSAKLTYEVHRVEQGSSRVLDSGTKIKPGSLALSSDGHWMYWEDGTNKVHIATMR